MFDLTLGKNIIKTKYSRAFETYDEMAGRVKILAKGPLASAFDGVHADNYSIVRSIDHRLISFLKNIQLKDTDYYRHMKAFVGIDVRQSRARVF